MSYRRKQEDKRRIAKLHDATKHCYGSGAWYSERKGRFVQFWLSRHSPSVRFYKTCGNKAVRKSEDLLQNGKYRRIYELKWRLY